MQIQPPIIPQANNAACSVSKWVIRPALLRPVCAGTRVPLLANDSQGQLKSTGLQYPGGVMAVEQKVKQIIVEQLGVDESQVDNNASFVDDLGADSLDIVELVMAFEEAFELEIPDEIGRA